MLGRKSRCSRPLKRSRPRSREATALSRPNSPDRKPLAPAAPSPPKPAQGHHEACATASGRQRGRGVRQPVSHWGARDALRPREAQHAARASAGRRAARAYQCLPACRHAPLTPAAGLACARPQCEQTHAALHPAPAPSLPRSVAPYIDTAAAGPSPANCNNTAYSWADPGNVAPDGFGDKASAAACARKQCARAARLNAGGSPASRRPTLARRSAEAACPRAPSCTAAHFFL